MYERFGALPLGELHAEGVCAYCGVKGVLEANGYYSLRRTVLPMTQAVAHVCMNTTACERRRYRKRNP